MSIDEMADEVLLALANTSADKHRGILIAWLAEAKVDGFKECADEVHWEMGG